MSPAIFEAYRTFAQRLTAADRASRVALRETAALADCVPLIDTLLASDQKLEQEAVDIAAALKEILQVSRRGDYHHNRSTHPGINFTHCKIPAQALQRKISGYSGSGGKYKNCRR